MLYRLRKWWKRRNKKTLRYISITRDNGDFIVLHDTTVEDAAPLIQAWWNLSDKSRLEP